jgi:hypothetical protein
MLDRYSDDHFVVTLNIGMIARLLLATVIPMCSKCYTMRVSWGGEEVMLH